MKLKNWNHCWGWLKQYELHDIKQVKKEKVSKGMVIKRDLQLI